MNDAAPSPIGEGPAAAEAGRVLAALGPLPRPPRRPALLLVSGLPGTGKSRFCRQVRSRTGAVILESDALRREIFGQPTYTFAESRRLFSAVHSAIDRLLAQGYAVILDATNLAERERAPLYAVAERRAARLVLAKVVAPPALVRRRLMARRRGEDPQDRSEAGPEVYRRMAGNVEEFQRPHHVVDTSRDTGADVQTIAEEMLSP